MCKTIKEDSNFYYYFLTLFLGDNSMIVNSCISMVELIRKLLVFTNAWG